MPGRPPKPTNLLELSGAFRKNPKRRRAREKEPLPPAIPLEMPARFLIFHPEIGYQKAEKLRAIWDNCIKMWPWVTFSDRDALEQYCGLKAKDDQHRYASGPELSGAEMTAMIRIRSELGGTGTGRARLGVQAAGQAGSAKASAKTADPRAAFLARKFG
jgi:hypothetical protein